MTKIVQMHDSVIAILEKMQDEHETKFNEHLSYSNAVKQLLKETERWKEPKALKKRILKKNRENKT